MTEPTTEALSPERVAHGFAMKYGLQALPNRPTPMTYDEAMHLEVALTTYLRTILRQAGDLESEVDTAAFADAIIAALAQQGVTLTREPPCSCGGGCVLADDAGCFADVTREPGLREAASDAVRAWLANDAKGLDGAMTDLAALASEDRP